MKNTKISLDDQKPHVKNIREEVLDDFFCCPKSISPKYFYDDEGSRLFDLICKQPEYYLTRNEIENLKNIGPELEKISEPDSILLELGSGNSDKIRTLLADYHPHSYVPVDISKHHLYDNASQLAHDFPWLDVHAICSDFTENIVVPELFTENQKIVFFSGSSIGNYDPETALIFLKRITRLIKPDGFLLIGVDHKKEVSVLNKAYNDAKGITAKFNLNVLKRLNRDLNANFIIENYKHVAFYNEMLGRVEMHLESCHDQLVNIAGAHATLTMGERIHTENSYKYHSDEFVALARKAGLELHRYRSDKDNYFGSYIFRSRL